MKLFLGNRFRILRAILRRQGFGKCVLCGFRGTEKDTYDHGIRDHGIKKRAMRAKVPRGPA